MCILSYSSYVTGLTVDTQPAGTEQIGSGSNASDMFEKCQN
jgi:hypothetical protein